MTDNKRRRLCGGVDPEETLWVIDVGDGLAQIDSVPFFLYNVSLGDWVTVTQQDGERIGPTWKKSGNRTIRIMARREVSGQFDGFLTETALVVEAPGPGLYAISVPLRCRDRFARDPSGLVSAQPAPLGVR